MAGLRRNRLLAERALPQDGEQRPPAGSSYVRRARAVRSVTVNLAESPLGWLFVHRRISERQFLAGERLREDWERAGLDPHVTMRWDAPPTGKVARGAPVAADPTAAQIGAKARFEAAIAAAGPGLADIAWRVICSGEGMRDAERALGWPARAGKLVLGLALDRLAAFYRIR